MKFQENTELDISSTSNMGEFMFQAHVPLPLAEKVDKMASRLECSWGWIMKQALSAWVEQEEERSRKKITFPLQTTDIH